MNRHFSWFCVKLIVQLLRTRVGESQIMNCSYRMSMLVYYLPQDHSAALLNFATHIYHSNQAKVV